MSTTTDHTLCPSCRNPVAMYSSADRKLVCTNPQCGQIVTMTLALSVQLWDITIQMSNQAFAKCVQVEESQSCDESTLEAAYTADDVDKISTIEQQQDAIRAQLMADTDALMKVQEVVLLCVIRQYITDLANSGDVTPASRKQALRLLDTTKSQILVTWVRSVLAKG